MLVVGGADVVVDDGGNVVVVAGGKEVVVGGGSDVVGGADVVVVDGGVVVDVVVLTAIVLEVVLVVPTVVAVVEVVLVVDVVVVVTGQLTQHARAGLRMTVAAGVTAPVTDGVGADRYSRWLLVVARSVPAIVIVELAMMLSLPSGRPPAPRADRIAGAVTFTVHPVIMMVPPKRSPSARKLSDMVTLPRPKTSMESPPPMLPETFIEFCNDMLPLAVRKISPPMP